MSIEPLDALEGRASAGRAGQFSPSRRSRARRSRWKLFRSDRTTTPATPPATPPRHTTPPHHPAAKVTQQAWRKRPVLGEQPLALQLVPDPRRVFEHDHVPWRPPASPSTTAAASQRASGPSGNRGGAGTSHPCAETAGTRPSSPRRLPNRAIRLLSPGVVLDPLVGTDTTTAIAKRLGRRWPGQPRQDRCETYRDTWRAGTTRGDGAVDARACADRLPRADRNDLP